MRKGTISWLLRVLVMLVFVPQASAQLCERPEKVEFTCLVSSCQQTIEVQRCRSLTVGENACANCLDTKFCCGIEVCHAVLGRPCDDGFVPIDRISQGLEVWRPERLEWAYVPDCRGHWVRLSILAERIRKKNDPVRPA
jgi:hypothetical protein